MTDDARQTLENIIAYCSGKWAEADQAEAGAVPPPGHLTAEKKAHNHVFHFTHKLLEELP